MSKNPEIYVFNAETLWEHDLNVATKVHQATVTSVVRQFNRMTPGQSLNAGRHNGRALLWSEDKLNKVLAAINEDE